MQLGAQDGSGCSHSRDRLATPDPLTASNEKTLVMGIGCKPAARMLDQQELPKALNTRPGIDHDPVLSGSNDGAGSGADIHTVVSKTAWALAEATDDPPVHWPHETSTAKSRRRANWAAITSHANAPRANAGTTAYSAGDLSAYFQASWRADLSSPEDRTILFLAAEFSTVRARRCRSGFAYWQVQPLAGFQPVWLSEPVEPYQRTARNAMPPGDPGNAFAASNDVKTPAGTGPLNSARQAETLTNPQSVRTLQTVKPDDGALCNRVTSGDLAERVPTFDFHGRNLRFCSGRWGHKYTGHGGGNKRRQNEHARYGY